MKIKQKNGLKIDDFQPHQNTVGFITTFNSGSLFMGIFLSQYFIPTTWTANLGSLIKVIVEVYTVPVPQPRN